MKPGVFITVDVECSMGGAWANPSLRPVSPERAIWGRYGQQQLGLPLICDILAERGLPATFFVDAFIDEQGYPGESEPICHYLLGRGHDVQLHIHPNHKHYALKLAGKPFIHNDNMADLPPQEQMDLLAEGAERLTKWTGRRPVAFRAGNMAASEETLRLLPSAGIRIDSSYTFPYAGDQCRFPADELYNGTRDYGGVLELALSGFWQPRFGYFHAAKPLDLMGISFAECRRAIELITRAGADAVVILHSFSLFKVRNIRYDGGRLNRIVAARFRQLCRHLATCGQSLSVSTLSQLHEAVCSRARPARSVAPCRLLNPMRRVVRKAAQLLNSIYWA